MLFTRCPSCRTTFRVTPGALAKAGGHVRCGRCSAVFDAREALTETDAGARAAREPEPDAQSAAHHDGPRLTESSPPTEPSSHAEPSAQFAASPQAAGSPHADASAQAEELPHAQPSPHADEPLHAQESLHAEPPGHTGLSPDDGVAEDDDFTFGDLSLAEIIETIETAGDEDDTDFSSGSTGESRGDREELDGDVPVEDAVPEAPDGAASDGGTAAEAAPATAASGAQTSGAAAFPAAPAAGVIGPEQVHAVLERLEQREPAPAPWEPETPAASAEVSTRRWRYACAAALALLAVQAVHHYRSDMAGAPVVGWLLAGAYAAFGVTLVPNWDVHQYQIMDWVAAAEAGAHGVGSLTITARIHNRGPNAQPYPYVHLQLKDRWERPVGSRVFTPEEYLGARASESMAPGDTARARLTVVDPGSDAYGFELDVCVSGEAGALKCATDAVFR